jgi:quercetin dioxygenase-like cupin family protein
MTHADAGAAGTAYWFLDTLAVVHSATPPLVIEVTIPPGGSPPLHVHDDLDDCSYLLDGALAVRCGERSFRADPGHYLPQPRGVPHTFRVLGSRPARMLLVHGDDSFLRLIRSLGVPARSRALPSGMAAVAIETLERALREVGVSVVGPSMTAAEADAIGGFQAWRAAGLPVAAPEQPAGCDSAALLFTDARRPALPRRPGVEPSLTRLSIDRCQFGKDARRSGLQPAVAEA